MDLRREIAKARKVVAAHRLGRACETLVEHGLVLKAEGDASSADLAAGGLKAPEQGAPAATRTFQGIPIVVDRPKGFVQEGVDQQGRPWRRVYHVDYGYVPGTLGGDGEGLDVFLGGDEGATEAHWILQIKPDGTFDEFKVMLGFADPKIAKLMYEAHCPRALFGSMCSIPLEHMKALLGIEPMVSVEKAIELIRKVAETLEPGVEGTLRRISKPFAGYQDFDACVATQQRVGHSAESARKICGSLQARTEKAFERFAFTKDAPPAVGGDLRYVLGIVLEPETVDGQGDIYSAEEIRKAAWNYMVNFRNIGLQHKGFVNGKVHLVESFIAPADFDVEGSRIKKGTWLMGLYVQDDEIWSMVKGGRLTGLSIGGWSRKDPP